MIRREEMNKPGSKKVTTATAIIIICISLLPRLADAYAQAIDPAENPEPQVFAEGIISTGHEFALTFTPDMKEVYFTRNFPDKKINHIMHAELKNGKWQEPITISFSNDQWSDLDPALSPSGRRLFFISTRPAPGVQDTEARNMDIWYADREGKGWGQPRYLDSGNSSGKEGSPTVSKDGTLCFFSDRGRVANANSIYCSKLSRGKYGEPEKLGPEINSEASDTSPFLSADGNTLLFYSTRPGGYGQADLYVSFRRNRQWSQAKNLGPLVNTREWEYNPVVSPDGKVLYFGRKGSIYWIPVERLKVPELDAKHLRCG
jgi:Tol biopolymer transport system component